MFTGACRMFEAAMKQLNVKVNIMIKRHINYIFL